MGQDREPRRTPRYKAVDLGPLPVDAINKALGTELEAGEARLSATAHKHMAEDHASDYVACIAALPSAIVGPTFVGQAPEHTRNFEIIRRVPRPDRKSVLVAVCMEPDDRGAYRVVSCYLIDSADVDARRAAGRLVQIPP